MSAAYDQMEADLEAQAKGASATNPDDQMEADLIAQTHAVPKSVQDATVQSHIRSMGGDSAALGAGEYLGDWAKGGWNALKAYFDKKGSAKNYSTNSGPLEDASKAILVGLNNTVVAPLFGVGAKIGGAISGSGVTYEQGKNAATINPSSDTAAAGNVIGSILKPVSDIASIPGEITVGASKAAGASPDTQQMVKDVTNIVAPVALSKLGKITKAGETVAPTAQDVLNSSAAKQSVGSAGAALDLSKQSPEFVADIQKKIQAGIPLNDKAIQVQALGDRLPVKMQFTKGQALEDPAIISDEINNRAKNPEIAAKRFNEQNQQLIDNLSAIREKYGENDFSSNPIERGQKLIDAYTEYDAAKQADIAAKYKALEDASQGAEPIDANAIYQDVTKTLQSKLKLTRAQQLPEFNELKQLADSGTMTFDNYHTLMQDLGSVIARGGDEAGAAKIIRNSLENMPLKPGAEALRGLRNDAVKAARERFQEIDKDQAYSDVVNGKTQPDHFIDKYITGNAKTANKAQIDAIVSKFGQDQSITDALNTSVIERLRKEAGIDEGGKGNFSQARYNKYLQSVAPKLKTSIDPSLLENLSDIGEAARIAKQVPAGGYVNTSNTATVLNAANVAENLGIPGASTAKKVISKYESYRANQDLKKSFEYNAGVGEKTKMSDLLKTKKKDKNGN